MSDISSNLNLPYLMPSQSQKHVTVNETIRSLDLIIHLSILDRDLTAPPTAPNDGERFLVAAGGSGAWSGEDGKIAGWVDGAWQFLSAKTGWTVWVADEAAYLVYDGLIWTEITGTGTGGNAFSQLGVGGATPDVTNRLAVASDAVLFNHAGSNSQAKINKNTAGDTASLLFQTGFSGRAEFGTTGDDNWHVKVSPDGAIWNEALVIDRTTGDVGVGTSSPLAKLDIDGPIKIKSYTLSTLPPSVVGGIIYVSDAIGGPSLAVGDGTNWLPLGGSVSTNQAPAISDAVFALDENLPAGTVVGVVTASDPDSGDVLNFAITAGDLGGLFAIDGAGQITTTALLDFEATSQHLLSVQATDDGTPPLSAAATITVNVNNVDDTAPVLSGASGSASVLAISGQITTDEGNGTLSWALVTGTVAPSAAAIIAGTGFVDAGSQAVSSSGAQNINALALAESTDHSLHFVQIDSALNQSGVASSASITTGTSSSALNYTVITSITEQATPGIDVGASQGVATNGTWFWTSADDADNQNIRVLNTSFVEQVSELQDTSLDFAGHTQINHITVDRPNDKLYVGANNFPTNPAEGWILEYDINTATGGLAFVAAYPVGANHTEGATLHNGKWWVCYHDVNQLARYSLDWVTREKTFDLALAEADASNHFQGLFFLGEVVYLNYHGNANQQFSVSPGGRIDGYYFDASADELIPVASRIAPPTDCNQGMDMDGTDLWMAERTGNIHTSANNVVRATFAESASRTISGPRLIGSADAFNGGALKTLSIPSYLAPGGSDRLALVYATWEQGAPPVAQVVSDITWGAGNSFTELGTYFNPSSTAVHNGLTVWLMKEADIPLAAQNITFTAQENISNDLHLGLVVFSGVDQAAPTEGLSDTITDTVNVTTLGANRTLVNFLSNANAGTSPADDQIIVVEALDLEFEGMIAIKDAPTAGVYPLGWTDPDSDRPISVGLALK